MEPIVIVFAFLAGIAARQVGFPPLLGYLVAGFIAFSLDIGDGEALAPVADAGINLLLFTIGLKLDLRSLKPVYVWGSALLHMFIAVPLTTAVIMVMGIVFAPLAFDSMGSAWTLAFALSFSSTVLAIKLFEERGEVASFYATIAIGILVVQDVLAVVYLVVSSGHYPSPWALLLLGLPFLRPLIRRVLEQVGHGELLLLSGIAFAFGAVALFEAVSLKGGLGALVMGVLLAYSSPPKSKEVYTQLLGLKNLLLIGFFLQIGYYGIPSMQMLAVALMLSVLILLRPVIYFVLLTRFGLRARTSWLTSLALFNYSEFGLIVAAIAVETGTLKPVWITTLALALSLSFLLATPFNRKAHELYRRYQPVLSRHEKTHRLPEEAISSLGDAETVILGMGRVGRAAYDTLYAAGHTRIVGIEENFTITKRLSDAGYHCVHGDASDRDFWEQTGLSARKMILVSLTNHRENLVVIKMARELGFFNTLAVATRFPDHREEVEALGCVGYYLYEDMGRDFAEYTLATIDPERKPAPLSPAG